MKNKLLTLAGTLAVLAVLGHFYAKPLLAQVRAALVQDVDNPARHPFYLELDATPGGNSTYTVPSGQRVIIEFISQSIDVGQPFSGTAESIFFLMIQPPNHGPTQYHSLYATFPGRLGGMQTPVRIYVDPGATLTTGGFEQGNSFTQTFMSGYTVTLP